MATDGASSSNDVVVTSQPMNRVNPIQCEEVSQPSTTAVYGRRWYILSIFFNLAFMQSAQWNIFAPLSRSVDYVFGWKKEFIALCANSSPIGFFTCLPIWLVVTHRCGLRRVFLSFSSFMTVSSGLLLLLIWIPDKGKIIAGVTFVFNGSLTSLLFLLPPLVSSVWFPESGRVTATTVGLVAGYIGVAASALIGPTIVSQPSADWNSSSAPNETEWRRMHSEITYYIIGRFAICAITLFLTVIYFPGQPPLPPSNSASVVRLNLTRGFCAVIRNRSLLFFALSYGMGSGTCLAWVSMLSSSLSDLNFSQEEAGFASSLSMISGFLISFPIARITDWLRTKHKPVIMVCRIGGMVPIVLVVLTLFQVFHLPNEAILFLICCSTAPVFGSDNVFYEMAAEVAFPVNEMDAGVPLALSFNIFVSIFFCIMLLPVGTAWMNAAFPSALLLSLPFLALGSASFRRLQQDHAPSGAPVEGEV